MYEEQMAEAIISFIEEEGYTPLVQIPHLSGTIDFIGMNSNECIIIESKISKWKSALKQAVRYGYGAEKTFVALPTPTAEYVAKNFRQIFEKYGIGLIQVDENNTDVLIECKQNTPSPVFKKIITFEVEQRLEKSKDRIGKFIRRVNE